MLTNLRTAAPTRPEVEELSRALSTRLLDISKQATAAKAYDRAAQLIAGARDVGARYNEAAIAQAEADLAAAREASADAVDRVGRVADAHAHGEPGISGSGAQARRRRLGRTRVHRHAQRLGR